MRRSPLRRAAVVNVALLLALVALPSLAAAHHDSGGVYHWQREENPFTLKVGDNVDAYWNQALDVAARDWTDSSVLNMNVVPGTLDPKICRGKIGRIEGYGRGNAGRIEVCFGDSGFLGVTFLLVRDRHLEVVVVAFNDFYFDNPDRGRGVALRTNASPSPATSSGTPSV